MDQVAYEAFKEKLDEAVMQNKKLTKENINFKRQNKYLKRVISKLKAEAEKDRYREERRRKLY